MNLRPALSVSLFALLVACPDPSATPQGQPGGPGGASGPGQPGPPGPASGGPQMPVKDWNKLEGDAITISGEFVYTGSKTGTLRLDFLGTGNTSGLQHTMTIDAVGPWTVKAPADLGDLYVVGFVDLDNDGPTATDPAGRLADPITLAKTDVTGLVITLSDTPDLGDLTPGGPHPGSSGGQPPGEGGAPPAAGGAPPPEGGAPPAEGAAPPAEGAAPPAEGGAAAPTGAAPAEGTAPPATGATGAGQ